MQHFWPRDYSNRVISQQIQPLCPCTPFFAFQACPHRVHQSCGTTLQTTSHRPHDPYPSVSINYIAADPKRFAFSRLGRYRFQLPYCWSTQHRQPGPKHWRRSRGGPRSGAAAESAYQTTAARSGRLLSESEQCGRLQTRIYEAGRFAAHKMTGMRSCTQSRASAPQCSEPAVPRMPESSSFYLGRQSHSGRDEADYPATPC